MIFELVWEPQIHQKKRGEYYVAIGSNEGSNAGEHALNMYDEVNLDKRNAAFLLSRHRECNEHIG